ncbi:hypothetical protein [Nocardioides pocheonensis]|uniref:Uncharacterized protein n=1 Tax=Nocardioides pocheonensis TaxID=661485 RepID=A0A3N0GNJ2_9ACTN|nr:hypothetical protein [Nocardioides pocheonensis]RNM14043.1 hypothetical protein EFL26_13985 [Nocardioides pocheonensis]
MSGLVLKPNGDPFGAVTMAQDYFWLPANTPYGNMSLKLMKIGQRIGHANLRLEESYEHWHQFVTMNVPPMMDHGTRHYFASEEAVFMLRRAADEMVALLWFLTARLELGEYPAVMKVDSIYSALELSWPLIDAHQALLTTLNEVTNAHKHSFVQSDLNVFGADEPCVAALAFTRNKLAGRLKFYNVSLAGLARDFSLFVADVFSRLQEIGGELSAAGAT